MQSTTIKKHVIGIDISNEQTTLAIVDVRGNIIAQSYFATATYPDISLFVARLTEEVITLAEGHVGYENIRSIGISCPSASVVSGCYIAARTSLAVHRNHSPPVFTKPFFLSHA